MFSLNTRLTRKNKQVNIDYFSFNNNKIKLRDVKIALNFEFLFGKV